MEFKLTIHMELVGVKKRELRAYVPKLTTPAVNNMRKYSVDIVQIPTRMQNSSSTAHPATARSQKSTLELFSVSRLINECLLAAPAHPRVALSYVSGGICESNNVE